jgi:hypothetical protein
MLAFVRPAKCLQSDVGASGGDCGAPTSGYTRFMVWLVDWLATAELLASILLGLAFLGAIAIALHMKKPRALRGEVDRYGPIAWPVSIFSAVGLSAMVFCWYHDLILLGWYVNGHATLAVCVVLVALMLLVASLRALKVRSSQFMRDDLLLVDRHGLVRGINVD